VVEGHEQAGYRPVLVLSVNRYNDRRRMIVAVPLTTKDKLGAPLSLDLGTVEGKRAFALPSQVRGCRSRGSGVSSSETACRTWNAASMPSSRFAAGAPLGRLPPTREAKW